jgi:hypothetical protein
MSRNPEPPSGRAIRPLPWPRGTLRGPMPRIVGVVTTLVAALTLLVSPHTPALAAPGDSIALYFSAPFVTGSHVTDGASTETFNSYATGNCPVSIPIATLTYTSNCLIQANEGTSPGSSEPAVGVPLSGFVSKTDDTTFTFANSVKYVGFWWMMGSNGNTVQFLDSGGAEVASFNMNQIITFLGPNASVTNADTRTVNRVDGGTHLTKHFYRSPATYSGTVAEPVMDYNVITYANEPWVYMNLFVTGSVEVRKVRFHGVNFEIDNLTVSTVESGPRGDMVKVQDVLGTPPASQVISWSPTNTTISDGNPSVTPSSPAVVTTPGSGGGAITYSVVNAGTSGCTVNSVTGVITYTAIGECVVRATAAAVPGTYYQASTDVRFTFTPSPTSGSGGEAPATSSNEEASVSVPELAQTGPSFSVAAGLLSSVGLIASGVASVVVGRGLRRRNRFL